MAGMALLVIGIGWAFKMMVLAAIVPALLVPLWKPIRQRLVEPRLGYVEFTKQRTRKNRINLILINLFGVLTLMVGLGVFFSFRDFSGSDLGKTLIPGLPALLLAVAAMIAAQALSLKRFLLYAGVLALLGFLTVIQGWKPDLAMTGGGIVVSFSGLFLLFRFLRKHPIVRKTGDD